MDNHPANFESGGDAPFEAVYSQLKQLAHNKLRKERKGHTLNTTGLVHEVYLKLSRQNAKTYQNQSHFMALAAQAMRRILIDYARQQQRLKRGKGQLQITHHDDAISLQTTPEEVLALNEFLDKLTEFNPRQGKVIEYWFFGGFNHEEIAQLLDVSLATVRRDWRLARLWLSKEMKSTNE